METFIIIGVCILCYQAIDFMIQCANGASRRDSENISESAANVRNSEKSQVIYTVAGQVDSAAEAGNNSSLY